MSIDILVPGPHIDKRISAVVAKQTYYPLVDHGVRIMVYQPTMMHVKAVLIDGEAAVIGSVNFNRRSVEKDEEVAVIALDADVVADLTEHFEDDAAASTPVTKENAPSAPERVIARLVRPIKREM